MAYLERKEHAGEPDAALMQRSLQQFTSENEETQDSVMDTHRATYVDLQQCVHEIRHDDHERMREHQQVPDEQAEAQGPHPALEMVALP